jgi:CxxC motif-containing protein (DUF1111 family)
MLALSLCAPLLWIACPPKPPETELGDPLPGLDATQIERFEKGKAAFERVFVPEDGLGPLFNANACSECHEDPVPGGVGDEAEVHASKFVFPESCDPLFQEGGPVIQQQATPLLQAKGIEKEEIPPSATAQALRTTPPVFGFGLVDGIPEEAILSREDPNDSDGDGISGRANRFLDGRLGRFGRKALVPTLFEFNAGAFPLEQGVTTPLQPVEETINGQPVPPDTDPAAEPEVDQSVLDAVNDFVQFLAPPPRKTVTDKGETSLVAEGEKVFGDLRCDRCHTPSMETGASDIRALNRRKVFLYSDLLLHDLGPERADICLGLATPSEFRTELLMGLRFREPFLHDGAAKSVEEAIRLHGGEALASRQAFEKLADEKKRALLAFLDTI